MKKSQKGFTLIELMIVVAIIGILASVAVPAYQDYIVRTKVSEGLSLAAGAKTAVTESRMSFGTFFSAGNASYGLAQGTSIVGNNVSSVSVIANGVIQITFSNDAAIQGDTLTLSPTVTGGGLTWACSGSVQSRFRPSVCR